MPQVDQPPAHDWNMVDWDIKYPRINKINLPLECMQLQMWGTRGVHIQNNIYQALQGIERYLVTCYRNVHPLFYGTNVLLLVIFFFYFQVKSKTTLKYNAIRSVRITSRVTLHEAH